jgi:two-component system sensor histidine kinase YesM
MAILQRIDFSGQGRAYVIDGAANVICGHQSVDGAVLSELEPQDRQHLENSPSADKSLLSAVSGPAAGGWRILVVAPLKPLLANAARLRIQLLVFAVLVGIIVYLLAFLYARSNAGRLLTLVKNMRVVQQGDFNVNCIVDSDDEIGELQSNFNLMVREIRLLLDRQYELGQSLKDSELKVLQAQINPHFLYNTLDLIVWTAANNQPDAVRDIVLKLSRYYRLSLSSGEDFIKISDELEHVRLYVELQNMRFRKKIELITKADPATRDVRILKLLLQPVVENSILHGIQNLDDREGRIEINVEIASQVLQITVADNGIGMEEGELQKIRLREQIKREDPGLGKFGLNNIMQRLYFSYGPQAGLTVDSFPGSGTTVVIRIPITKTY